MPQHPGYSPRDGHFLLRNGQKEEKLAGNQHRPTVKRVKAGLGTRLAGPPVLHILAKRCKTVRNLSVF